MAKNDLVYANMGARLIVVFSPSIRARDPWQRLSSKAISTATVMLLGSGPRRGTSQPLVRIVDTAVTDRRG